ncbi:Extracellular peptidase inhibitor [Myotis brandtii]|uniref:Extracellular peptidase inhibitor n=1 Tax=Myotis brandtii TaxID=109478 RepID=S7MKG1_MYOBR|nr:Extracellular peptidase inhibitor [Myotis brandtii]
MRTGTVFVLVAFVILGMEMAFAQRPHRGGNRPGFCPEVTRGGVGICEDSCWGDYSCPRGMKCCSTGCGRACQPAEYMVSINHLRADKHVNYSPVDFPGADGCSHVHWTQESG